jgi:hypothetical protein
VTIDDNLIHNVFRRAAPGDLDQVLTALEGYRTCVATLRKLRRTEGARAQKRQAREYALSYEKMLADYVITGNWKSGETPRGVRKARVLSIMEW